MDSFVIGAICHNLQLSTLDLIRQLYCWEHLSNKFKVTLRATENSSLC